MNILDQLRAQRDAARDAALAIAQGDDFNPDAENYRGLIADAERLNTQIEQIVAQFEARNAQAAIDQRILNLGQAPAASGVSVGQEAAVYRPDGQRSFFADMRAARLGDGEAREMLDRHARAMTTATAASGGGNIVPPEYIASLFAPDPKFGSPVAASFPQYTLSNASAFKLPRQTGATSVANQASENTAPAGTDPTFDQITVTPVTRAGKNVFSRQLLDGANPAIDQIIASDLRGELLEANDTLATSTLLATSGADTDTASGEGKVLLASILKNIPGVYGARKQPADTIYMSPAAFGFLSAAVDSTGRPLINAYAPTNAIGVGSVADLQTSIGGLPVVLAPHLVDGSGTLKIVIAKRSDFGWFASPVLQFRYEEKAGPESIEIGVWQYVAAMTGRYPKGVRVITHTTP